MEDFTGKSTTQYGFAHQYCACLFVVHHMCALQYPCCQCGSKSRLRQVSSAKTQSGAISINYDCSNIVAAALIQCLIYQGFHRFLHLTLC